jgi:hypothetical protein
VHVDALSEQPLGQVTTVLAADAGDQGGGHSASVADAAWALVWTEQPTRRKRRLSTPLPGHAPHVTTALSIVVVLAAWTLLPLPLAVVVGRMLRAGAAMAPVGGLAGEAAPELELTVV